MISLLAAGVTGVAPASAACADDPYVRELVTAGDDFRAVSVVKEAEFRARPTDEGFACARLLLGLYLRHQEFDLADGWLAAMVRLYPQVRTLAPPERLGAEMAFLFGNHAEVRRRLDGAVTTPSTEALLTFSGALAAPGDPPPITCGEPACADLRRLYDRPETRSRKSAGLALALSAVPGLGQMYAGRFTAGVGSLLLNGVLGALTAFAAARGERAAAVTVGSLGAALYLGNFYAGYEAARRENERRDSDTEGEIRRIPLDLALYSVAR